MAQLEIFYNLKKICPLCGENEADRTCSECFSEVCGNCMFEEVGKTDEVCGECFEGVPIA